MTVVLESINFENPIVRIASLRNVSVVCWFDAPKVATEIKEMERAGKKLESRFGLETAMFNVIISGTPSFSQEIRDEVARVTSNDSLFARASAHVLLVDGLVGSAVRAFLSTALLISRTKTPNKVFSNIDTASGWVCEQLATTSEKWTVEDLAALVHRVSGK